MRKVNPGMAAAIFVLVLLVAFAVYQAFSSQLSESTRHNLQPTEVSGEEKILPGQTQISNSQPVQVDVLQSTTTCKYIPADTTEIIFWTVTSISGMDVILTGKNGVEKKATFFGTLTPPCSGVRYSLKDGWFIPIDSPAGGFNFKQLKESSGN